MAKASAKVVQLSDTQTNGGEHAIDMSQPYVAYVQITGQADLLFHRWNSEAVEAKAASAKGSKAKKTDNIESYVWRNDAGELCLPGEYLRGSIVNAAKFTQDPRSPRKSGMDLFKAGVVSVTPLASLGTKEWHYEDKRRVLVQRQGINRVRPALRVGWQAEIGLMVVLPEYISPERLREVIEMAGRLIGVGDFRPTYGRFSMTGFSIAQQ